MQCEKGHEMQPLTSKHNPAASEWYCEKCHLSIRMSERDRNAMMGRIQAPEQQQ